MDIFETANNQLRNAGLWRDRTTVSTPPSRWIVKDGRKLLNFASNNYLGLATETYDHKLATGSGGSRLICGTSVEADELEAAIADYAGMSSSLVFSSGYQCNVGILQAIGALDVEIFSDALNHASLIDGCRLAKSSVTVFPHLDYQALEAMLRSCTRQPVIVSESLFSMDGDRAGLTKLFQLRRDYNALLVLDEAHALGLFDGLGLSSSLGLKPDIFLGTLSKAAGWSGGFVAGTTAAIEYFRNASRSFIFSTAPSPQWFHRATVGIRELRDSDHLRKKLWENCEYFGEKMLAPVKGPIFPIPTTDPVENAAVFREAGVWVQPIRYPTVPRGTERLRITLSATHERADLDLLVSLLRS